MRLPKFINKIVQLVAHPGDYVKAEINHIIYEAQQKLNEILVQLLILLLQVLIGLLTLVFASITLALWLNQLMMSNYLGFLIISVFYLLIFVFVLILKKRSVLKSKLEVQINNAVGFEEIHSETYSDRSTQKRIGD